MRSISAYRIKPNPAGKDRDRFGSPTPAQLGAEWVDLRNHGPNSVNTSGVSLFHLAYPSSGGNPEYALVARLPDCLLDPGQVLRVHSGKSRELSVLRQEDRTGADWHSFTGEDRYVWNNHEGDSPTLYEVATQETIDSASYDPDPPEGAVLYRHGAKLVVAASVTSSLRW